MRTTMRSESTLVPPVTAERSPPLSRMTGADSPVIADSSTEAMPSMISPSPGISSPASTTTRSPLRSDDDGTLSSLPSSCPPTQPARHGLLAHPAQRVRLRLAAPLGDRLGEVGEEHREPEPDGDRAREPERRGRRLAVEQIADEDQRGEQAADLDHEHDRVLRHVLGRPACGTSPTIARLRMSRSNSESAVALGRNMTSRPFR